MKTNPQVLQADFSDSLKNSSPLEISIKKAQNLILSQQFPDGYWWYTLEANESIPAEFIFLMHYMGHLDRVLEQQIAQQIRSSQNQDGSWSLYYEGPGDLSTTIECYLALKISGLDIKSSCLAKARDFILSQGGLTQCRIFTRIHLALFGLIPWDLCPAMPVSFIHFPNRFPINIYEFSSWARACIVPLLVIMNRKKETRIPGLNLDELYKETPHTSSWSYKNDHGFFSLKNFFIQTDKVLLLLDRFKIQPFEKSALKKCEAWIREHIARTEDIYPALAYGALALYHLGYTLTDPIIQKALIGLKKFRMLTETQIPPIPQSGTDSQSLYQQCCVSPVWDTPWTALALLESGLDDPLLKTAHWLKSKQILDVEGDWKIKNKEGLAGGWSFEFENDFFPDVDDTIAVLSFFLKSEAKSGKQNSDFQESIARGLNWMLSMQSDNGGWAAFDKNNVKEWLNGIPFADHGACLDPPTPDITARVLELLALIKNSKYAALLPLSIDHSIEKAVRFIEATQETWGPWWGRWGVNYIYGTWCVLQGLQAIGYDMKKPSILKAVAWLKSVQNADGGFGESCQSYIEKRFIPTSSSTTSQAAWALMGLLAGEETMSPQAHRAAEFLIKNQNSTGGWDELYHTGTGFPGHFYIRYHGYRHYFPLLALGKCFRKISD